jgi:polyphosphate kinase
MESNTYLNRELSWLEFNRGQLLAKLKEILEVQLGDIIKRWSMQSDGNYVRTRNDGSSQIRCQELLHELLQSENGDFRFCAK